MSGIFRVIAVLVLVALLSVIGVSIYNAGVSTGLSEVVVTASGAPAPVVYYPGPYAGHAWGFGFFGIVFWILGIFLVFGLLRAAFGWGRWGGRGGPGGRHGWKGSGGPREHLEDWHRQAHEQPAEPK